MYFLVFIFTFYSINAQLHISPSSTADCYIHLSDRLLYSENNINLDKNNSPEIGTSIYLRKKSQLLQSEKSSNQNSGNGWIPIFKEATYIAFDYSYWALPVKNNMSQDQFAAVIFQPKNKTKSQPIQPIKSLEGSTNPLKISRRWIYKYSGIQYNDWQHVGDNFSIKPGESFTLKGENGTDKTVINGIENNSGNRQRYNFRGLPNDGEIKVEIKRDQSVLMGNPYPSVLHLQRFLIEKPASTGIDYFWDFTDNGDSNYLKDYEGDYGFYSGANSYAPAVLKTHNGEKEETGNGPEIAREYNPVSKGFMLSIENNSYVFLKNSQRRFQQENAQPSEFKNQQRSEISLLKFNVGFNDLYTRPLLLAFRENSSRDEDWAMDAKIYAVLENDAGWNIQESFYNIQVRPFRKNDKIPLIIELTEATKLTFSLDDSRSFETDNIYLFDAELETYTQIDKNDFSIDLQKGSYSNRFFIRFMQEKEDKPQPEISETTPEPFNS